MTSRQRQLLSKLSKLNGHLFGPLMAPEYRALKANGWASIAHNRVWLTKKGQAAR